MSSSDTSLRPFRPNRPSNSGTLLDDPDDPDVGASTTRGPGGCPQSMSDRIAIQKSRHTPRDEPRECYYTHCDTEFVAPQETDSPNTETRRSNTGAEYPIGHNNAYCSKDCLYFKKGERALRGVQFDHRYCASCFRTIKELEPPGRGHFKNGKDKRARLASKPVPAFATDRQHYLFYTVGVEKTVRVLNADSGSDEPRTLPSKFNIVRKGGGCPCGVAHHATVHRPDRISTTEWTGGHEYTHEDEAYIPRLVEALDERQARDAFDDSYSEAKLYDEIKRRTSKPGHVDQSQRQLCEALGAAIRTPRYRSD